MCFFLIAIHNKYIRKTTIISLGRNRPSMEHTDILEHVTLLLVTSGYVIAVET